MRFAVGDGAGVPGGGGFEVVVLFAEVAELRVEVSEGGFVPGAEGADLFEVLGFEGFDLSVGR